jgi:hypothetical protein
MREFNVFVSDSWRVRPSLTVSAGLRYVLQNPFYPTNDSYTTLTLGLAVRRLGRRQHQQPARSPAAAAVRPLPTGSTPTTRSQQLAPSVGAAWQVPPSTGFMKWLRGSEEGDVVVRGGWAMAYQRPGLSDFTGRLATTRALRVAADGIRPTRRCRFCCATARQLPPLRGHAAGATRVAHHARQRLRSDIQLPVHPVVVGGLAAQVSRDSAIELRYVGSKLDGPWDSINLNEPNITSNGFLNEFRLAQANLQANIAAGRGSDVRLLRRGTDTSPLPIFLAHLNAQGVANAGNAALYTGTQWTNATNLGFLAAMNPNPWGFASAGTSGLIGNATFRNNAVAAGCR